MYPLDEFAVSTVIDVITDLLASGGIDLRLNTPAFMARLRYLTDPEADPALEKDPPPRGSSPFHLTASAAYRAPWLLFKILSHNPARWTKERHAFAEQFDRLKERVAQAASLDDENLLLLLDDVITLFKACLYDGAMYYGLGLVWVYWRAGLLFKDLPRPDPELTSSLTNHFIQLLLTDPENPASRLFDQFLKLSKDAQEMDFQAFMASIPDSAYTTAVTSLDMEEIIFTRLRSQPKGPEIESQVDALLADMPVPLEKIDWSFSSRSPLPYRLLITLLGSEPFESLEKKIANTDATKLVEKKLPWWKRSRWRWSVKKGQQLMAGAMGTIFLLLEMVPTFHQVFDEVAIRLLRREQIDISTDLHLLPFHEIQLGLLDRGDLRLIVRAYRGEKVKRQTERRISQIEARLAEEKKRKNNPNTKNHPPH